MSLRILRVLFVSALLFLSWDRSSAQSLMGSWQFEATSSKPSASMQGVVDVLFDSASYVVGAIRIDKKIEKFHGRHFGSRFIARTDTTMKPLMRLDANLDSSASSYSGNLQIEGVKAQEAGKKPKVYNTVLFAFFASKAQTLPAHRSKRRKRG